MSSAMTQVLFLVVFIAIMYMLLIRPQKKKEKAVNLMRNNLKVGDEIITIGGICGKVVKTKDESLIIQVGADKMKFEVMRWAISRVIASSERSSVAVSRNKEEEETEQPEQKKTLPKRMKKASDSSEEKVSLEKKPEDETSDEETKESGGDSQEQELK